MSDRYVDYIFVEKTMNSYASSDKLTKNSTTTKRTSLTKAYSYSESSCSNLAFITPQQFVELVSQNSNSKTPPILDCRSQFDFGSERIRSSHNINCRTKIMARKLVSKRLEDVEPNLLPTLVNSDTVIIYDQSTEPQEEKVKSSPINLVVQAANKSNKKVHIILGGLDAVKTQYPHLIECPNEVPRDHKFEIPPFSPDTIDKENVVMTEIVPHVYVGNICDAQNQDRLNQYGITHIINCTPDLPLYWEDKYEYRRIDILDLPSQNIRKHFDSVTQFIDSTLDSKDRNVLVHCSAGISRSPTLVLAYMIKKYHWTFDESFEKMRKLRSIVDPNVSFIMQLRDWEKVALSPTLPLDLAEDSTRSSSNTYCGSTSKTKTESKSCTDSAITVK